MRAELRRALTTRHRPVHNHARAQVAPACARPRRRPPAQKMHAGEKVVKHTLFSLLGASGDEESPNSGGAVARRRGAPASPRPPRTNSSQSGHACSNELSGHAKTPTIVPNHIQRQARAWGPCGPPLQW